MVSRAVRRRHCLPGGRPRDRAHAPRQGLQPAASRIRRGLWRSRSWAAYTAHRGELLIFASSLGRPREYTRYAYGAIVGRGLLVDCYRTHLTMAHPHQWRLVLARREVFAEPIPYRGQPSLFYIRREVATRLPPRYEFRIALKGNRWGLGSSRTCRSIVATKKFGP